MATTKTPPSPATNVALAALPAKKSAPTAETSPAASKPIKTAFHKTALVARLAAQLGAKDKAAMAALGATILGSAHGTGAGKYTSTAPLQIVLRRIPLNRYPPRRGPLGPSRLQRAVPHRDRSRSATSASHWARRREVSVQP
jgi:hypothetical protein